jgi:phosphoglycolate phosphatase-like HAD superfamily hydrolase
MVGDRSHDMLAARGASVRAWGAGWGYGDDDELRGAEAELIASSPASLLELLPHRTTQSR